MGTSLKMEQLLHIFVFQNQMYSATQVKCWLRCVVLTNIRQTDQAQEMS